MVDIVFLKGFYLDGQKHRDDEPAYLSPIAATNPADVKALFGNPSGAPAPLPLTAEQIAALKQKNAQQGYQ